MIGDEVVYEVVSASAVVVSAECGAICAVQLIRYYKSFQTNHT